MADQEENKRILSEVIKRQMAILGPDITLAKVKNVPGIEVDSAGNVLNVEGDTQAVLENLINQFVELSGLIVKKTMESILMSAVDEAKLSGTARTVPLQLPQEPQNAQNSAAPIGYNVGGSVASSSLSQNPVNQNPDIVGANRDLEELNKMLNNLGKS